MKPVEAQPSTNPRQQLGVLILDKADWLRPECGSGEAGYGNCYDFYICHGYGFIGLASDNTGFGNGIYDFNFGNSRVGLGNGIDRFNIILA